MNKESSNTMVRRGRSIDKIVIMIGAILIVGVITFTAFQISHSANDKKESNTQENKVQTEIVVTE